MNDETPTVFIVDDDPAVRDAISLLLRTDELAVATFASAAAFLESTAVQQPGCLVLDVRMPGMSGLDLQKRLRARGCHTPILFVTGHGDVPMAIRAMKGGAFDFLEKPFQGETLLQRVREALALDARQRGRQARRAEAAARLALLSPREREVLDRVAAGQYNKVIAFELGISLSTVEIHRKRVMEKLEAESLSDLIQTLALANDGE
jgi:two-component system response regulator FixJ